MARNTSEHPALEHPDESGHWRQREEHLKASRLFVHTLRNQDPRLAHEITSLFGRNTNLDQVSWMQPDQPQDNDTADRLLLAYQKSTETLAEPQTAYLAQELARALAMPVQEAARDFSQPKNHALFHHQGRVFDPQSYNTLMAQAAASFQHRAQNLQDRLASDALMARGDEVVTSTGEADVTSQAVFHQAFRTDIETLRELREDIRTAESTGAVHPTTGIPELDNAITHTNNQRGEKLLTAYLHTLSETFPAQPENSPILHYMLLPRYQNTLRDFAREHLPADRDLLVDRIAAVAGHLPLQTLQ